MNKVFKTFVLLIFGFFNLYPSISYSDEKIRVGLLIPITGENKNLGQQIIKSTRMALKEIGTEKIEIYLNLIKYFGSNFLKYYLPQF